MEATRQIFKSSEVRECEASPEALKWMGWLNDSRTHSPRLHLLIELLSSNNVNLRYASVLGLLYMNDLTSLTAAKYALSQESDSLTRNAIGKLLNQLSSVKTNGIALS